MLHLQQVFKELDQCTKDYFVKYLNNIALFSISCMPNSRKSTDYILMPLRYSIEWSKLWHNQRNSRRIQFISSKCQNYWESRKQDQFFKVLCKTWRKHRFWLWVDVMLSYRPILEKSSVQEESLDTSVSSVILEKIQILYGEIGKNSK